MTEKEFLVPDWAEEDGYAPELVAPTDIELQALVKRVSKGELKLTGDEARILLGTYDDIQTARMASARRFATVGGEEVAELVDAAMGRLKALERWTARVLKAYALTTPWGRWALSIKGVGPIGAAGLCVYVDPARFSSVGKVWRTFGLDPTIKWGKGQKRPYIPAAQRLAYLIGESIIKVGDRGPYGPLYKRRKAYEWERNLSGQLSKAAQEMLPRATEYQRLWVEGRVNPEYARKVAEGKVAAHQKPVLLKEGEVGVPMLPPVVIHARARRWVVKLLISHFWEVRYWYTFNKRPPLPYAIAHKGHVDYIPPPNAPWEE